MLFAEKANSRCTPADGAHAAALAIVVASVVFARPLRTQYLGTFVPLGKVGWSAILAVALLLAAALALAALRSFRDGHRNAALFFGCMAASASLCAYAFATAPASVSERHAVTSFLPYLELPLFVVLWRKLPSSLEAISSAFAMSGALVAASVLLDAEGLWNLGDWGQLIARPNSGVGRILYRPAGWLASRNYAAEYIAVTLPLALASCETRMLRSFRFALFFVLATEGLALGLTRCRTGWIATGLGLAVIAITSPRSTRRARLLLCAVVLLGMVLAFLLPTRLQWNSSAPLVETLTSLVDLQSGSGKMRWDQYRETFSLLEGHFLRGLGMGGWQGQMRHRVFDLGMNAFPSSDYLRLHCDGGFAALFLACLGFAAAGGAALRAKHTWVLASFVALATVSLANAALFRPEMSFAAAALAVCALKA